MNRMRLVHTDTLSCEPILRRMPNGELLIAAQCGDIREPAPLNRVYVFHSSDNGDTWSSGSLVWPEDGRAVYLTEVTVIDQTIRIYLTLHNGHFVDWECRVVSSQDNGYTWTDEGRAPCFPRYTFLRGQIRLADNTLVMAYQHYPISEAENARLLASGGTYLDANVHEVITGIMRSEDNGKTWTAYPGTHLSFGAGTNRKWVWSEPTLCQRKDGTILMLLRVNETGYLWQSESHDGGRSFSVPVMTDIPNPSNKPKLLKLNDGRIALIHTPNNRCGMRQRHPLAIWLSSDDGATWPDQRIVSDFPCCFCYPDGIAEGMHLLFSIEYNRHDIMFVDFDAE